MAFPFHYYFFLFSILLSSIIISPSISELCNPADKKALLAFKKAFNNPYVLTSWDPNTDCCTDWYIVQCDPTTNRIVSFELVTGDISGQIPAVIGDLPYLRTLALHKQANLTGPIPAAITKLKKLEYLFLTWNNLTGNVPSFLADLPNLVDLHLSFNNLTGSIPSSLSKLRNLSSLRLDRNKLTGKIPSSLGLIKNNSLYLVLSHNQISGNIPTSFRDVDFGLLDLSYNRLCGQIPVGGTLQSFGVTAYFHNRCLCGAPLNVTCK